MDQTQTDQTQMGLDPQKLEILHTMISRFLAENCSSNCLDNDEEVESVSGKLAHFLLTPGAEIDMNPDQLLPRAKYKMGLSIVDEPNGEKICSLVLNRTPDMNFFWVTVGRTLVNDKALRRTLELAGIIITDGGDDPGGFSPQSAM
jgi:hypothetical protein